MEVFELPLFQRFFDALEQHAKAFFMDAFKDMCRCDRKAVEGVIEQECKVKWNRIYALEREAIQKEQHYSDFIRTVSEWERRLPALPKPEQSTPDLPMAYYHATHVQENFRELFERIKEKLPADTILSGPALKHPYRALEKMALEESDRKWTAHCVLDLLRGAIECKDTGEMNRVLMFLDTCIRSNDYEGLVRAPAICIMRVKNRFEHPTKGGWAGISINFVFVDDPNRHVQELQLQHSRLVLIRKRWGEDAHYAGLRVLAEFLQSVPTVVGGEAKQELGW
jgi:hypothetical protein